MRIVIKDTKKETGRWTAEYIWKKIETFGPTAERPFVLGLPTGSSPMPVYTEWIKMYKAGEISFKNVVTFNMDEYVGCKLTRNRVEQSLKFTQPVMIQSFEDELQINDNFHVGYAYDFTTSELNQFSNGSHEIMLNYRVKISRIHQGLPCPSYW